MWKKVKKVKSLRRVPLFATLWNSSLPGFSLHGILQARVLEWVAISFSRGSSRLRDRTQVSHIGGRRFNLWATREANFSLTYRYEKGVLITKLTQIFNFQKRLLFSTFSHPFPKIYEPSSKPPRTLFKHSANNPILNCLLPKFIQNLRQKSVNGELLEEEIAFWVLNIFWLWVFHSF